MKLDENPFYVLGLATDASRIEIEREAQKLLGMLELGFTEARSYTTSLGVRPRTSELVRAAVAALRDPGRRLAAELWAQHTPERAPPSAPTAAAPPAGTPGLRRALGWRP